MEKDSVKQICYTSPHPSAGDSVFLTSPFEVDAVLETSSAGERLHPTGPLAGAGDSPLSGEVAELEQAVFAAESDLVLGMQRFGLRHERRTLRMRIGALEWSEPEPNTLRLAFTLGQGSYATSVLRELIDYDLSTESRLGSAHGRGL